LTPTEFGLPADQYSVIQVPASVDPSNWFMDAFSNFSATLVVDEGGRLTGRGALPQNTTIAGVLSPSGNTTRTGPRDGPVGSFFIQSSDTGQLPFTSTSTYEVDLDLTLPTDAQVNDRLHVRLPVIIDDGAQLRVRVSQPEGRTAYQVGRRFNILTI